MRFSASCLLASLVALGCGASAKVDDPSPIPGSTTTDESTAPVVAADALPLDSLRSDACVPDVQQQDWKYRLHVARDTPVDYETNPPSWGAHYATWVEYGAHRLPVDRREYVHNAEHGAIVLLYKCSSADGCLSVAAALATIAAQVPEEAFCAAARNAGEPGIAPKRIVIAPDPDLDTPIAAVAWGWTYTASCFDEASLLAFATAHVGLGPENNCFDGGGGALMTP